MLINHTANVMEWKKSLAMALAELDIASISSFIHEPIQEPFLVANLNYASLFDVVGGAMSYLSATILQARNEYEEGREEGAPAGPALDVALDKISASITSEYRRLKRKLSIFLLSSVTDIVGRIMLGLADISKLIENPYYIYYALLIITKPSIPSKDWDLKKMEKELNETHATATDDVMDYTQRYKSKVLQFLEAGGRDTIRERALHFHMSLCANPTWGRFISEEFLRSSIWYVTWPAQQILTTELVFDDVIKRIITRVITGLQSTATMNMHMAAHVPAVPPPPPAPPAKKAALAARNAHDTDRVRFDCAWCSILFGTGQHSHAHSHGTDGCFAIQTIGKAVVKGDPSVLIQMAGIVKNGKLPVFQRDGRVTDGVAPPSSTSTPTASTMSAGGGRDRGRKKEFPKTDHPSKNPVARTALVADNMSSLASSFNFYSSLYDDKSDDGSSDDSHLALMSMKQGTFSVVAPPAIISVVVSSSLLALVALTPMYVALQAAWNGTYRPTVLDTGCTHHLFGDTNLVHDIRTIPAEEFSGMGEVKVSELGESVYGKTFVDRSLKYNLVSLSQLEEEGAVVVFRDSAFFVSINGNPPMMFDRNVPGFPRLFCVDTESAAFMSQHEEMKGFALAGVRKKRNAVPRVVVPVVKGKAKKIQVVPSSVAATHVPATANVVAAPVPATVPVLTPHDVAANPLNAVDAAIVPPNEATNLPPDLIPIPVHTHGKERAVEARRAHCALGHPGDIALGHLLNSQCYGTVLTSADLRLAHSLLGECIPCSKGKETQHTTGGTYLLAVRVGQVVRVDLIYGRNGRDAISRKATMGTFLLLVDELTGYTVLLDIVTKTQVHLMEGLRKGMAHFQKYGHVVEKIVTDAESCFGACATDLGNMHVVLEQRPPGEHEKFAEAKTRVLRAQMRAMEADLGFVLPDVLAPYLAIAATFMGNLVPNVRTPLSSPHMLVTGERVDMAIYAKFVFGQAVLIPTKEAPTATNRSIAKATEGMFLGHLFGSPGSAYFLLFPASSKADIQVRAVQAVREMKVTTTYVEGLNNLRPQGTIVPMSVEDDMNRVTTAADFAKMVQESRALTSKGTTRKPSKGGGAPANPPPTLGFTTPIIMAEPAQMHVPPPRADPADVAVNLLPPAADVVPPPEVIVQPPAPAVAAAVPAAPKHSYGTRRSPGLEHIALMAQRTTVSVLDLTHTALLATLSEELDQYGPAGEAALMLEAKQMHDLKVFEGTDLARKWNTLSYKEKREILNCRAFLESKRDGRVKARIIGGTGASRQDRSQYPDVSSPTVRFETVTILLKVAAVEGSKLAVLDVPGAYLHAPMQDMRVGSDPDTPRYVKVSGLLARVLVRLNPEWQGLMSDDGVLVLKLNKALYGLVESARLWNIEIAGTLTAIGFVQSLQDPCLFTHATRRMSIVIYVDDFLAAYKKDKDRYWLEGILGDKYGKPRVQSGDSIDYLNLRIRKLSTQFGDFQPGSLIVDQSEYCRNMLAKYNIVGTEDMPHGEDFFSADLDSPFLSVDGTARYVSMAMSLLFTCNRVRSDVFLHTSFLCTRLKFPTEEDLAKLERVMRYIAGTIDYGIVFSSGDADLRVFAWIDASYATHDDAKGHSGTIISVGSVPGSNGNVVYVKSRKQKLVARSSTEAELIALHDGLPQVVWTRNVLEELGYKQPPAEVYQDNKSTIFMCEAGHGNHHRSKHISVRYFYAKGLLDDGVIQIKHLSTDIMLADTFTKALNRCQFLSMRDQIMTDLGGFNA